MRSYDHRAERRRLADDAERRQARRRALLATYAAASPPRIPSMLAGHLVTAAIALVALKLAERGLIPGIDTRRRRR